MSFLVVLRAARQGIEEEREMLQAHWEITSGAMRAEIGPLRIVTR